MDIFNIFTLFGGLAFFLFGMSQMSEALSKLSGGKLEKMLKRITSSKFKSILAGAGVTALIQSSSALTVMLVGLVNSGIMQLKQAINIVMGSNIGTTITAWILSLSGIKSTNFFVRLLKPESFSPILALVGIIMMMLAKDEKKSDVGKVLISFSVLMYGMQLMSSSVSPLSDSPVFASLLTKFSNPLLGVLAGLFVTAVIQSSAASVGILQAISLTGNLTFMSALPIIMGQNIGTCITSVISAIGANNDAKRVAAVHVSFNVIGTVICMALFYGLNALFSFSFLTEAISPVGIALLHTAFNLITTMLLIPFTGMLEKIARIIIKDKPEEKDPIAASLDERLLATPAFAIAECSDVTAKMANESYDEIMSALDMVEKCDAAKLPLIERWETDIDKYEDKIGTFLVKLNGKELNEADSRETSKLLHLIGDFERISDHGVNIAHSVKELKDKEMSFSPQANAELKVLIDALGEILKMSINSYKENDLKLAKRVEPLEEVIDHLTEDIRARHIQRLRAGECTIELGFVLSDFVTNMERVSDHCSNIALCIISISNSDFETHEYVSSMDKKRAADFDRLVREYSIRFKLPDINRTK